MISMRGQTIMRITGIIFWVIAIIILMATYGVFAKPILENELNKGFFSGETVYHTSSLVFSILFLTLGTFLIVYPFKKKK